MPIKAPAVRLRMPRLAFSPSFKAPNPLVVTPPTWGRRFLSPQRTGAESPKTEA